VASLQDHETMRQVTVVVSCLEDIWRVLEASLANEKAWRYYNSRINTRKKPAARDAPKSS
jgi:hypothetical protein